MKPNEKSVRIAAVLKCMKPGRGYSLSVLAKAIGANRAELNVVLGNAVVSGKLDVRKTQANASAFYIGGTAPDNTRRAYRDGEAGPIVVYPAATIGQLTGYAAMLNRQRDLSMTIRRG